MKEIAKVEYNGFGLCGSTPASGSIFSGGSIAKIGEFLVRIGAMSASQVTVVINHQKEGDERLFGEIAMELGYLANNEPIDKFLEYQEKQLGD